MVCIDLHDYYPYLPAASYCLVTQEVADFLNENRKQEHAYLERVRVHRAYYPLEVCDLFPDEMKNSSNSLEQNLELKQQRETLLPALQNLSRTQRRRVLLYFEQGLSVAQIAEAEGVGWPRVQKSIQESLKKLKKFLEEGEKSS